jgi:hypothetical protein
VVQNNLICVHYGDLYGPEYVLNLWRGARRSSNHGFNFYVFTDNIAQHPQDLGWRFVKLPNWQVAGLKPWWYKLEIFNYQHQLEGNNLYLDLDTVIVNNIDEFWSAYPNKAAKAQAVRAWNKHKPDLQVILDALEWQKETDGWKRGFVPMASTYINNARWEDENPNDKLNDIFAGAI